MHLTRVGFGAWAIGGGGGASSWGNQDDTESIAAIRYAVESGVNWIDTAAVYGLGHSEEVVAAALAGIPEADRPYVFTKAGLVWDPAERSSAPRRAGDPASLRAEVEASLRRLRVERIDLYQMHWPAEDGTAMEEYWQTFLDLKREGKIRAAGLSNHDICRLEAAEGLGHLDAVQPPLQPHPPRRGRRRAPVGPRARDRGDRLQPHGFGPAHRSLQRRAGGQPRSGRLAGQPPRFPGAGTVGQPGPGRGPEPDRRAPRRDTGRRGWRLGAFLARRDRGHRRCPPAKAGRGLAARGGPGAEGGRPGRHRRRHRRHRSRGGTRIAPSRRGGRGRGRCPVSRLAATSDLSLPR